MKAFVAVSWHQHIASKFMDPFGAMAHPTEVKFLPLLLGSALVCAAQSAAILPKEADWKPVTADQRWSIYKEKTFASSGAYFRAFGAALGDHTSDRPAYWPQGLEGYSRRVGQRFVTFTLQDSVEAGLSASVNYDPRYLRCKCTGAARFGHAIKMNFLTVDGNGKKVLNWPKFAGAYGAGMLSTTWVKDYKWSAEGIRAGNTQLSFGILFNVVREFTPEIKRAFRRK